MRAVFYAIAAFTALLLGLGLHYAGWAKALFNAESDDIAVIAQSDADAASVDRTNADHHAISDKVEWTVESHPDDEDAIAEAVLTDFGERLRERVRRQKARRMRAFEAPNAAAVQRLTQDPGFAYAALEEPAFPGGSIRSVSFLQASLRAPVFNEATLEDVDFSGAFLTSPNFADATMRDVRFIGARIENGDFRDAALKNLQLNAAQIYETSFRGSSLLGASFDGAYLRDVDFQGSHLGRATFYGAVLHGVNFEGAHPPSKKAFAGACIVSGVPPRGLFLPLCEEASE